MHRGMPTRNGAYCLCVCCLYVCVGVGVGVAWWVDGWVVAILFVKERAEM
jgi:hypothetical protein